mmetsp:Transcript_6242/g.28149  ORF Transcript_6242/g.28149 Transcript_6242/m.28149 type:complete len:306 (-) Transcript_6242:128-1045(-)
MASWSATPSLSALLIRDCCFRAHSASSSLPEAASESESAPPGPSSEDESPPSESASKNRLTKPIFLTTRPPSFFPGFTNFGALTVIPFKNVELAGFLSTTGRAVTCVPIAGLTRTTGAGTRAAAFATAASALAMCASILVCSLDPNPSRRFRVPRCRSRSATTSPLRSATSGGNLIFTAVPPSSIADISRKYCEYPSRTSLRCLPTTATLPAVMARRMSRRTSDASSEIPWSFSIWSMTSLTLNPASDAYPSFPSDDNANSTSIPYSGFARLAPDASTRPRTTMEKSAVGSSSPCRGVTPHSLHS